MADRPLSVVSTTDSLARAANVPLPADDGWSLREPYAHFLASGPSIAIGSPRDSCVEATPYDSGTLLSVSKSENYIEEEDPVALPQSSPKARRRPLLLPLVGLVALIVVVLAVILPVYFRVIKPRNVRTSQPSSNGGGGTSHTPPSSANAITGADGSSIKASDGTTFTYNNKLGGICKFIFSIIFRRQRYLEAITHCCTDIAFFFVGWSDPNDPYNTNAYPNSWTPPLNQSWNYGTDRIYGSVSSVFKHNHFPHY